MGFRVTNKFLVKRNIKEVMKNIVWSKTNMKSTVGITINSNSGSAMTHSNIMSIAPRHDSRKPGKGDTDS